VHPTSEVTPAASEETALVVKAQAGDAQAFTDLVNRYERKIYRIAKHITQNDEDAEDVLQETFLKAYEHLSGFQGNSKFYTWIVRIAVNESPYGRITRNSGTPARKSSKFWTARSRV